MRHIHGGRLARVAVTILLTSTVLAACGGDSDEEPSGEKAPTTADFEAMHEAVHEVGDLIDEAGDGAGTYQQLVSEIHDKDSAALLTDPRIPEALDAQQERQDARNVAIAALADQAAMEDPDVAAAYQAFAAAAKEMFGFQDGYNASMPELLRALDVCSKIFDVDVPFDAVSVIPGVYEHDWLEAHAKRTLPCQQRLAPLTESENYRIRQYVDSTRRVIIERNAAVREMGLTKASMDRSVRLLKKANEAYLARQDKITAFSAELGKISAIDEYQALDAIFEERLGTSSPSSSPSSS